MVFSPRPDTSPLLSQDFKECNPKPAGMFPGSGLLFGLFVWRYL